GAKTDSYLQAITDKRIWHWVGRETAQSGERNPRCFRHPTENSGEIRRPHANHRERMLIDRNGAANHFCISVKMAPPQRVRKHNLVMGPKSSVIGAGQEKSACLCPQPQELKVVRRNDTNADCLRSRS